MEIWVAAALSRGCAGFDDASRHPTLFFRTSAVFRLHRIYAQPVLRAPKIGSRKILSCGLLSEQLQS